MSEREVSKGDKRKGFQKLQIRVCSWNNGAPVLEKRILVLDLDGVFYPYKSTGFNAADFDLLLENKEKIYNALRSPCIGAVSEKILNA